MRKTDKKIDNQLRATLTDVCDVALKEYSGFQWLTHQVSYQKFPSSLKIICIFDSNAQLASFHFNHHGVALSELLQHRLQTIGIKLNNMAKHIEYDTEENCHAQHHGNWALRLSKTTGT